MFGLFNKATDPVCRMKINKKEAKFSLENEKGIYYFCSNNCKEKFNSDSKKYLKEESVGGCCH